ncbi:MAG TPA: hypothetical protein VIG90_02000 [Pedomonas sp.]|uniref:hypothetical protein n=1 Tax=Pedomonas sp. TaxID=2976421 RepID=UPI002F3E48D4
MGKLSLPAIIMAVASAIGPANAQTTATHGTGQDRVEITVPVTASISGRCGFSAPPDAVLELGNLEIAFSRDLTFVLQCNSPLRLGIVSANGGLKAPGTPTRGYTNLLDYTVTLHAVGTGGVSFLTACTASSLASTAAAPCQFRGPASATAGMRLPGASSSDQGSYLRVSSQPAAGSRNLMASANYSDVLMLTLSPST